MVKNAFSQEKAEDTQFVRSCHKIKTPRWKILDQHGVFNFRRCDRLSFFFHRRILLFVSACYTSGISEQCLCRELQRKPFRLTVELNPQLAPHHEQRPIPRLSSFLPFRSIFNPSHVINCRYTSPAQVFHLMLCLIASRFFNRRFLRHIWVG